MFLICVFQKERFNRFLWVLASLIKNNGTLRKCYLFSCRYKNLWDIGIYSKPHFYEKCKITSKSHDRFSLTSANKPQSSLVLHLQVWRPIVTVELAAQNASQNATLTHLWKLTHKYRGRLPTDYPLCETIFLPKALLQETE